MSATVRVVAVAASGLERHPFASGICRLQVWRAYCPSLEREVAVKLLDLESVNCSLVRHAFVMLCFKNGS